VSDSKIGRCQGDALNLKQAELAPKQINLKSLSMQAISNSVAVRRRQNQFSNHKQYKLRIFLLSLLLLFGCSKEPKNAARLNISFNTHPNTIDPRKASDFVSSTLVCMVYEGLTRFNADGLLESALLESVEINPEKTIYIFKLKKAYWTDGKPITAYDFENSWKEILKTPTPCTFLFYPIKNAEKYVRKEVNLEEVGIYAIDAQTLFVELEYPTPYFYSLTAFPSFLPAPSSQLRGQFSGPFQIEKMVHNHEIVLKKNEKYWNAKNIPLDEIHISIVPDEMTALQMFEKGDLDWIGGSFSPLPLDAIEKWKSEIKYVPSAGSTLCTFNTAKFPFQNQNLRKAFSLAINRLEIVEKIEHGVQIPAHSILPPAFSSKVFLLYDPIKALDSFKRGIEELGIEKKELEKVKLYFRTTLGEKRLAQALQKQWQELFGITIELAQLDFKTHAEKLQSKDYEFAIASWIAQFEDPVSLLERFKYRDHLKNYPAWESALFQSCLAEAVFSSDREERLSFAEKILFEETPLTAIYHWSTPILYSSKIKKIAISPCGGILFEHFELR
jgi:oligopeptide transport system substrate-binding protein